MNPSALHIDIFDLGIYLLVMMIILFGAFSNIKNKHDNIDEFYFFFRDFFPKFWDNWAIACLWGFLGLILKDELGYPLLMKSLPFLKENLPSEIVLDRSLTFASVYLFGRYIKKIQE